MRGPWWLPVTTSGATRLGKAPGPPHSTSCQTRVLCFLPRQAGDGGSLGQRVGEAPILGMGCAPWSFGVAQPLCGSARVGLGALDKGLAGTPITGASGMKVPSGKDV